MKESVKEIKALDQLHVKGAARGQSGLSVRGGVTVGESGPRGRGAGAVNDNDALVLMKSTLLTYHCSRVQG